MKDIYYTSNGTAVRDVFRDDRRVIVRCGAVFPDVCMGCGGPAYGNVEHKEFTERSLLYLVLPVGLDALAYFLSGKRYHFDIPFCSNCPPDRLRYLSAHFHRRYAFLTSGEEEFPPGFMNALLPLSPEVEREVYQSWF